ncbi:hypothetical protein A0256_23090 [Mucilaginibacter sp. PAMC 26640]|nr:hypothetical protein A0256_23090 [Mucilaginibacter sp. PAMC 26640]
MKKIFIICIVVTLSSCIKEQIPVVVGNPLLGYWKSGTSSFSVNNLEGKSDPYSVTKNSDSLTVILLPAINYHYKIISVDKKQLVVTSRNERIVYERVTSDWEK